MNITTFNELTTAIYAALGEWTDHIQLLIERQGVNLGPNSLSDEQLREAITAPLLAHVQTLQPAQRHDLRVSLQYLLNQDALIPYSEFSPHSPGILVKKGAPSQRIRDGAQDAVTPYDGYALCQ